MSFLISKVEAVSKWMEDFMFVANSFMVRKLWWYFFSWLYIAFNFKHMIHKAKTISNFLFGMRFLGYNLKVFSWKHNIYYFFFTFPKWIWFVGLSPIITPGTWDFRQNAFYGGSSKGLLTRSKANFGENRRKLQFQTPNN